jgi:hypothetical protein
VIEPPNPNEVKLTVPVTTGSASPSAFVVLLLSEETEVPSKRFPCSKEIT